MGVNETAVVAIRRDDFEKIMHMTSWKEIKHFVNKEYPGVKLSRRNVIILDQAVHHYTTFDALTRVCWAFDATVFAFAVFLNRLNPSIDMSERLQGIHFVSLYEWHWPPFKRAADCPCKK